MGTEYCWVLAQEPNPPLLKRLESELGVPPIIAQILLNRGIEDFEGSRRFLKPLLEDLNNPFLMADMERAAERLSRAIDANEKILIYGDYDVDGVTAVSYLLWILRGLGTRVSFYIPDRLTEGYGVSAQGITEADQNDIDLMITVDCGITAIEEVRLAKKLGIDVIITDHHQPGDRLPEAVAVLDPKRYNCSYPFKELAGVGIAFKLTEALFEGRGLDKDELYRHLDLVALGTAADVVPLIDENRVLVKHGIQRMAKTENPGLQALLENVGLKGKVLGTGHLLFIVAPRINAGGRMGSAERAVRMLTTEDEAEAVQIADILEIENRRRKGMDERTFAEASRMVEETCQPDEDRAIVLASEGWHPGVIGIVASRIVERFYLPTILISIDKDIGKGSGRSIPEFDLYFALRECRDTLMAFGGHRYAAGLTIEEKKIDEFRESFQNVAKSMLTGERLGPKLKIEGEITLDQIDERLVRLLRYFAPFGPQNPRPTMVSYKLEVVGTPVVVGRDHLKFKVRQNGKVLSCIGFGMGELIYRLTPGEANLDMVYVIDEDEWQGEKRMLLRVKDLR
ncbi:MAG TPA: single-stranded-DNA-specific exonuclease RecJ [Candidatus Latescibacteria bacterium]|nr:single-stranded-DNA-specific exonuclease RecJ [Candidatus Latescibacterota bacterium]